jgi:ketosteroid isomerase-like protein
LTQQQKDQIQNEVRAVGDSLIAAFERMDVEAALQFYAESADWKMFNADGSAYDYQTTKKFNSDWANSATSYKWTTTRQDFIIVTKDFVICAWVGKDETLMKSGDKVTYDPHAYTLVFKKIAGQWKVIYQQDSGIAVTQKAAKK